MRHLSSNAQNYEVGATRDMGNLVDPSHPYPLLTTRLALDFSNAIMQSKLAVMGELVALNMCLLRITDCSK